MIIDPFENAADSVMAPAADCFAILPHDSAELAAAPKAIYVGTGGDLVLRSLRGAQDVTFRNLPSGSILDVRARFVRATGTTAGDLVGLA